ncbi:AraC-type DNA-binding protein [Flavobacteriaceae bacterium MAR_2010_188]|nr:AraC-type DNA-binding protein [Flavobacteriaceae bacterium MAR_2010_188]
MTQTLHVKNMVCNRCKSTVVREIKAAGFDLETIELGKVTISGNNSDGIIKLEEALNAHGFEIIKDDTKELIEQLKITLIQKLESQELSNLSEFLPNAFHRSYSALSKLFSKTEGMTIEKYLINLKIEKVKEYIQLGQLNFSEIAYALNYTNSGHLARQFKNVTGMSMSEFKTLQHWDRKSIDQIV